MPVTYPSQKFGRYRLGLGLTYKLIHDRFGFDLGERYHRDLEYRIKTTMQIDRAVFDAYGKIGLGYEEPFPRVSIEPFGHRFMPAMYGCECRYAEDADPCSHPRQLTREDIDALPTWTAEGLETSEPVRIILSQVEQLKKGYGRFRVADKEFNPHCRGMSSLQNLGSVINTAFSIQGQQLFLDYAVDPDAVRRLYRNITQLMLLCLERFPRVDGWPLTDIFLGNCTVSMISPRQYAVLNESEDRCLMEYARSIGARFMIHQDSDVNPHLEGYSRFEYAHGFDFGQDTDFEKLSRLCPLAEVNCILFPSWIRSHPLPEIREELRRLMQLGERFRAFSFTLLEVDTMLGDDLLFAFCDTFRQCAR